jgi:hypothetical protein
MMLRLKFREWSIRSAIRACVYLGPTSARLVNKLLLLHNRVSKKQQKTGRVRAALRTYVIGVDELKTLKEGLEAIPEDEMLPSDRKLLYNVSLRLEALEAGEDLRTAVLRDRSIRRKRARMKRNTG